MDENDYSGDEIVQIYEDIKKRVHDRFEVRAQFAGNVAAWVGMVVALLILDKLIVLPDWFEYAPYVMGLWLVGLFIHLANWTLYELRERALQHEIERSGIDLRQLRMLEKRKRQTEASSERLVRLTDDGEIIDLEEDEEHRARYG